MSRTQRHQLGRLSLACIACVAGAWAVKRQFDPAGGPRVASARGVRSAQTAASRPAWARISTVVKRTRASRTRHYTDFGLAVSDPQDNRSRNIDPMALCLYHCVVEGTSSRAERAVAHEAASGELDTTATMPDHGPISPVDWGEEQDNRRPGLTQSAEVFSPASAIEAGRAGPMPWATWSGRLPKTRDSLFMWDIPLPAWDRGSRAPVVRYVIQPPTSTAPAEASWAATQAYLHR